MAKIELTDHGGAWFDSQDPTPEDIGMAAKVICENFHSTTHLLRCLAIYLQDGDEDRESKMVEKFARKFAELDINGEFGEPLEQKREES